MNSINSIQRYLSSRPIWNYLSSSSVTRNRELAELDTALPWLEELAEQRSALSLAGEEGLNTREVLDVLTETLKDLRDNRCEQLRLQQKGAQNSERELSNQLSIAQHSDKEARTKLERLERLLNNPFVGNDHPCGVPHLFT